MPVVCDLFHSIGKGNNSVLALLDFSSVFDTIYRSIIVHRLHADSRYTYSVLQWYSFHLTDRTQYTSLSNHHTI